MSQQPLRPDEAPSSTRASSSVQHRPARAHRWRALADDAGMATAEYAVVTLAAVGFAGLLLVILKSSEVRDLLLGIIRAALSS
ncbi:DUF4244 domain-containing protein [Cellulomonas citrea]|uniref:DUF4244 domain-containing protein n=1 Tax=Cellulomonas citrea TaxID=1909423 RepID=UPI001357CA5B|nr:DUF4244 domain-containing protein [Cellulomonas citrea]